MSILGWIVLGLIAGFIASKIVKNAGEGLVMDIVLGIVGALDRPASPASISTACSSRSWARPCCS